MPGRPAPNEGGGDRGHRGERIYRFLLGLYPPAFRREYGEDLLQAFRDRRRERRHRGSVGWLRLGMLMAADLLRSAPAEWWRAVRDGVRDRPSSRGGRDDRTSFHDREDGMRTGLGTWGQDVAFALRTLSRRPGYACASVVTLAVGIAGATTMFGILDGVVLRPLPYAEANELVQLGARYEEREGYLGSISPAEIHGWRERLTTLEHVAASRLQYLTVRSEGDPEIVSGAGVSGSFFDVLGVGAERGRLFGDVDEAAAAPPVAVLTWGAWQRRWGGDPSVLGRAVAMDGIPFTIVGVLARDYVPPEAIHHGNVEVYFPLQHVADDVSPTVASDAFLQAVGRLAPGVGIEAARDELTAVERELLREYGMPADARFVDLVPLHDRTVGDFGRTLVPFLGAVGLLLLIACANVASLALVRATERGREMALRSALGAGRGRLVRQLLTESLVLAGAAGAAGALGAYGAVAAFRRLSPDGIPRAAEVVVDPRALLFALGLAVVTGLVFGLAPVLHVLRTEEGVTPGARRTDGQGARRGNRLRSALVAGEVALALVLFVGAGLLLRSFVALVDTELGFDPAGAAWITPLPEGERWESPETRLALYRELTERLQALPGVVAAGGTSNLPLSGNESVRNVTIDGFESVTEMGEDVSYNRVLPGFFEAVGTDVIRGRTFAWNDDGAGTIPAVINTEMARRYWSGGDAVGGRLRYGSRDADSPWMEVVGVVEDVRQLAPGRPPVPQLYVPYPAFTSGIQTLVVRADGNASDMPELLRGTLREVAPDVPVRGVGTLQSLLADSVLRPRFFTTVLAAFAAISLLLAVVGVYGVLAYAVRQRTRELGVRMALGADRGRVRAMVLRRGLGLTAVGLVVGLGLSLLSTRLLEGLIYEVTPTDPATLAGAVFVLATAATVAAWLPAARATRIDPSEALRADQGAP